MTKPSDTTDFKNEDEGNSPPTSTTASNKAVNENKVGKKSAINTRSEAKKHKNKRENHSVSENPTKPTDAVIDMTNDEVPATPKGDLAKKRRLFSPARNMDVDEEEKAASKQVTPDLKVNNTNRNTKPSKIDLTESESAGKAEAPLEVTTEEDLKLLAKIKPASLLRKIGSLHNHLSLEIVLNKDLQDRIHTTLFDEAKELSDVDILDKEKEESTNKIRKYVELLSKAYMLYDEHGHYKNFPEKAILKKQSIRSIPMIHDDICGGVSGGQKTKLCTARNCKVNKHIKTRFGLKYEKALYLVLGGNFVYPIPIVRKEQLSSKAYLLLAEAEASIQDTWDLRQSLVGDNKNLNDVIIYSFLGIPLPHAEEDESEEDDDEGDEEEVQILETPKTAGKKKNEKDGLVATDAATTAQNVATPTNQSGTDLSNSGVEIQQENQTSNLTTPTRANNPVTNGPTANQQTYLDSLLAASSRKPKITVKSVTRDNQIRLNVIYHILIPRSDQSSDYIREACSDTIGQALENAAALLRDKEGNKLQIVWAPWFDDSDVKCFEYSGKGSITVPTKTLSFTEARELMNNAYLNFREKKNSKDEDRKRSVNVRFLFNGSCEDRDAIRKEFQDQIKRINPEAQVWMSRLQTVASPVKVGYLFYSAPSFVISPLINRIIDIIYEETGNFIETSISNEPAFEDSNKRKDWYESHDLKNPEHKEELTLRKVPTFYCEAKYSTVLALYLFKAFQNNPPARYLTKCKQRFVPAAGVLLCHKNKRSFSAYLADSAKLPSMLHTMVTVPGFNTEAFYKPIVLDPESHLHISPFSIVSNMPRGLADQAPAFHQVGKAYRESEIQALCIPSLVEIAPTYGRLAIHFVNSTLKALKGESYLDRILTPEARMEVTQYIYDLKTHEITAVDMEIEEEDDDGCLEGFENISSPFKSLTLATNPINFTEMGSLASRQAEAKNKAKSALSAAPKFSGKNTDQSTNDTGKKHLFPKKLNRTCLDDLVENVVDPEIIIPLTNLLSGTKSKDYSRKHIPGMHKVFTDFFKRKDIYIPPPDEEDDKSVKSSVSEITNMTGVSAGGAFHEDFVLGHQPGDDEDKESDKANADDASTNTKMTGVTLGAGETKQNKVVITNLNGDNENDSVITTMTGATLNKPNNNNEDASKMTTLTGATGAAGDNEMEEEEDDDPSEGDESSRVTTLTGITKIATDQEVEQNKGGERAEDDDQVDITSTAQNLSDKNEEQNGGNNNAQDQEMDREKHQDFPKGGAN
eukprot:15366810-Ditylum_brightwellii.AAC.2